MMNSYIILGRKDRVRWCPLVRPRHSFASGPALVLGSGKNPSSFDLPYLLSAVVTTRRLRISLTISIGLMKRNHWRSIISCEQSSYQRQCINFSTVFQENLKHFYLPDLTVATTCLAASRLSAALVWLKLTGMASHWLMQHTAPVRATSRWGVLQIPDKLLSSYVSVLHPTCHATLAFVCVWQLCTMICKRVNSFGEKFYQVDNLVLISYL